MTGRPVVTGAEAENVTGEVLEAVLILHPDGSIHEVKRADVLALDLGGLAIAYKDADGKIHRVMGCALDAIFHKSSILRPA